MHKYRKGDLTKEEQQFLISYYNLFQMEPHVIDILTTEKKNEIKNEIKENIWNNISKDEQPYQKIGFINRRFIKWTAAAAVFLGFTISLFFVRNGLSKKRVPASPGE